MIRFFAALALCCSFFAYMMIGYAQVDPEFLKQRLQDRAEAIAKHEFPKDATNIKDRGNDWYSFDLPERKVLCHRINGRVQIAFSIGK